MADFPSGPIQRVEGRALVVAGEDIDTDRIIPARFLKCVSFDALGEQAFADDRKELEGAHPFDQPQFQGASILVVNGNFGCGSSREHAPQALMRWGIRAVVGVSFAEIFFGNCLALGIPCTTAAPDQVLSIQAAIQADPSRAWTLDLEVMKFSAEGESWTVSLADGPGEMLRSGRWDATSQLLANGPQVDALMEHMPYLNGFRPAI
ncbi:MAG: 3-isopropylmalate dehydratase small subunit 1 [Synechococcus sp. CC9902]|nr:MAG: 3-isopropylmalate dehydratase small subunit 1 [Synechococcus sp. CC9902]|tara:strand:+ start:7709 stop:8326 length:618 start_codon:yes stop_codon:yes gene_type:complete